VNGVKEVVDRFKLVSETVSQELALPYVIGQSDCFFMALRVADAVNGTNVAEKFEGVYSSPAEIKRYMASRKFRTIGRVLEEFFERVPGAQLALGDIAVVNHNGQEHTAVCGGTSFIVKSENGREVFSLDSVKSGFKV